MRERIEAEEKQNQIWRCIVLARKTMQSWPLVLSVLGITVGSPESRLILRSSVIVPSAINVGATVISYSIGLCGKYIHSRRARIPMDLEGEWAPLTFLGGSIARFEIAHFFTVAASSTIINYSLPGAIIIPLALGFYINFRMDPPSPRAAFNWVRARCASTAVNLASYFHLPREPLPEPATLISAAHLPFPPRPA